MLTDVTILRQSEDYDFQAGGRSVKGIKTVFNVGHDGPFSVFLADDVFTPEANLNAIETRADAVRGTREQHADRKR